MVPDLVTLETNIILSLKSQISLHTYMHRIILSLKSQRASGVEEISPNMFKTSFPSRSELQRMIEWGVVQMKDHKAVMVIEEGAGGGIFKQALRHIWVQMTGLPKELRDFPTI
jgi:hypothetical protein